MTWIAWVLGMERGSARRFGNKQSGLRLVAAREWRPVVLEQAHYRGIDHAGIIFKKNQKKRLSITQNETWEKKMI